jgi:plasmid stabilization system protein ParE
MVERVLDAIDSLEIFPRRTVVERQSPKLKYPVRSLPVKPYVIYFRVIEDEKTVIIRHIRHGARRKPEKFD